MKTFQSKAELWEFLSNYLDKYFNDMEADVFFEIMEEQLPKMTFQDKKKLMMMILESCQSTSAQIEMMRDTMFN